MKNLNLKMVIVANGCAINVNKKAHPNGQAYYNNLKKNYLILNAFFPGNKNAKLNRLECKLEMKYV